VRRCLLVLALLSMARAAAAADLPACGLDFLDADAASSLCLPCHARGGGRAPQFVRAATHPFDVRYRSGPLGEGRLRPVSEVAEKLTLPGGLVACTTCHVGASRHPFRLGRSMSDEPRSERLCDTCHDLP
jgi:hypothetical protein